MVYDRNIERHSIIEKEIQSMKLKIEMDRKTGWNTKADLQKRM